MSESNIRRLACTGLPLKCDICGRLMSPDGFCHHRRRFDCHVLILVLEGTLHITSNGVQHQVQPGEYILLPAGEEHAGHQASRGRLCYLWVHLRGCSFAQGDGACAFPETGGLADAAPVTKRFMQVMEMSLEEPPYPQAMMDYAASLLVMELAHACAQGQGLPVGTAARATMGWIRRNYQQPFTVQQLAQAVGYQASYLSACFRKSTGMTIVQYTNGLRLRMAKALLSNGGISIKEAAFSCGFPDEKYFMRLFKQQEGVTPTQFRDLRVK